MSIHTLRQEYHHSICQDIIRTDKGFPNFADKASRGSINIAWGITNRLGCEIGRGDLKEQTVGDRFETYTKSFLEKSFGLLRHLRPGNWRYSTAQTEISGFEQYEHLAYIKKIIKGDSNLASALGGDYIVKPDIVIARKAVSDEEINQHTPLINPDERDAQFTPLRQANRPDEHLILHASVSCKWTIRSDRSQNTRTEALNLVRNRKGRLPHIVAVTAEPLPTRIATLAMGTGDLDCVYHFALAELFDTLQELQNEDQLDMLNIMVEGRRLRDISDLPFDLAI
jgi:hypothetical protein